MTRKVLFCFLAGMVFCTVLSAQQNRVSISTDGQYRYIEANGIPDHATGAFPNAGNPNSISAQNYSYQVPLNPQLTGTTIDAERINFGVALNGVPFDPETAEFWNNDRSSGWRYEALSGKMNLGIDNHHAHVQPSGAYHYHGIPTALVSTQGRSHSNLIGYAADGFPIYAGYGYVNADNAESGVKKMKPSYRLKAGVRPNGPGGNYDGTFVQDYAFQQGSGDLDECNGRSGVTPDYPQRTYHYFLTDEFPFVPRCFKGTPDSSFSHQGRGQGQMRGQMPQNRGQGTHERSARNNLSSDGNSGRPGGRHPDLQKAAAKLGVSFEDLRRAMGPPPPDFSRAARSLGISESKLREAVHSS